MKKKISLLLFLLYVQYWPIGCTSCGLGGMNSEEFVIENFELHAAELDSSALDLSRYSGWTSGQDLSIANHVFVIYISETGSSKNGFFSYNPFMQNLLACEPVPFSKQKISEIHILSDAEISHNSSVIPAGEDLSSLFDVKMNFDENFTSLDQLIDTNFHLFTFPNEFALFFRLSSELNWDDISNQRFQFRLTLNDGRVYELGTDPISIYTKSPS